MGRRRVALARALAAGAVALSAVFGGSGGGEVPVAAAPAAAAQTGVLDQLELPNGDTATVYDSGVVQVLAKDHRHVTYRAFPGIRALDAGPGAKLGLVSRQQLIADLVKGPQQPYVPQTLLVVFAAGVTVAQDVVTAAAPRSASPALTSDAATNQLLGKLGADRVERLFRTFDRGTLSAMARDARTQSGAPALDISSVYRVHVTGAAVPDAAGALLQSKAAVYASPDWTVSTAQATSIALPEPGGGAQRAAAAPGSATVPTNFAVADSAQSLLDTPGTNALAAYDEVTQYLHQVPGQGEIVTNVSVGDLYDASAASNPNDPCTQFAQNNGPTTRVANGQRFLDLPSLPLIPTYTADTAGNLNGLGEVCGVDQALGEVGLDFSVMSPLPHDQQRAGEVGSGPTDLLGIAPGATYRLVVPASSAPGISDIDGALMGAGMQSPQPNVITASLGFGFDTLGFPGRYLEEDPLTESLIASLVQTRGIVVSISANDGTRTFTNAAISPSGGAAPTNTGTPSNLNDVRQSTVASQVADSGAIDVGGTTLDDVFAAPPQFATSGATIAQHAYPETRWTGFTSFASGFGSRVNISAPADNVVALQHHGGGSFDSVDVVLSGGTSASAPEVAAAAAVVQQVARVTGHPFASPGEVRSFLIANADPVPQVPQADTTLNVGPQLNLARAVESLLRQGGITVTPAAPRVAVAQRRNLGLLDGAFRTDTDPANIDLQGPSGTDRNQLAWITIAPDWEGLVSGATFSLTVNGTVLATTRWARLLPARILAAAGLPVASTTPRTVQLTYQAVSSGTPVSRSLSLTFGPADATVQGALAPNVPAVVTGSQIAVTYDLTGVSGLSSPTLQVSAPGRVDPSTGNVFRAAFSQPLTATRGTVNVPVSSLGGGGIYGVGILLGTQSDGSPLYSDFAFTRVAPSGATRPAAPLLATGTSTPGHFLEIPLNGSLRVSWNVANVSGATGALIEVGYPGPGVLGTENTFNNPNGTVRDANGHDFGSVFSTAVTGTSGTTTLSAATVGLTPAMAHVVRVIATSNGNPVGEASDVSTVVRDGVRPADGAFVNEGFGIDPRGTTGLITSGQHDAAGNFESTVETFDQTTGAITATAATSTAPLHTFVTPGWGIWGGGVGLVGDGDLGARAIDSFHVLNPVSSGRLGAAWTPPSGTNPILAASNEADANGAFIYNDPATGKWPVFTSNIPANTFSPVFDTSAALSGLGVPGLGGFDENTSTRTGVGLFGDFSQGCSAPDTILTTNLATGASTAFTGTGPGGLPNNIAVDSTTNRAVAVDFCSPPSLEIYDLAARTGTVVTLPSGLAGPGASGIYTAADPQHGLFLVERSVGGDVGFNNNALSQVLVYNEQGQLLSTLERTNIFSIPLSNQFHDLQVDPVHRIVYGFGPGFQQLQPLGY
ncbi:MAG TPA: S8 family serine peptidase [Candidatus Dormibacteraeota bacterium]|nr:S8 family serine peptidase [Candidatus Dormibacteraeota bacterium]